MVPEYALNVAFKVLSEIQANGSSFLHEFTAVWRLEITSNSCSFFVVFVLFSFRKSCFGFFGQYMGQNMGQNCFERFVLQSNSCFKVTNVFNTGLLNKKAIYVSSPLTHSVF